MLGVTIENAAHLHDRARARYFFAKDFGTIRRRKNGFAHIQADFAPVDIESGYDFDIVRLIVSDPAVHEANRGAITGNTAIKIDPLDERTGAIAYAHNSNTNLIH